MLLHPVCLASFHNLQINNCLAATAIHGVKWLTPTRVVCFSCEESQEKTTMFKNTLCWLGIQLSFNFLVYLNYADIQSGRTREFRRISTPEPTYIRGIRISPLRQYMIILLKDRPFELWELRNFSLTRTFKPFTQVTLRRLRCCSNEINRSPLSSGQSATPRRLLLLPRQLPLRQLLPTALP